MLSCVASSFQSAPIGQQPSFKGQHGLQIMLHRTQGRLADCRRSRPRLEFLRLVIINNSLLASHLCFPPAHTVRLQYVSVCSFQKHYQAICQWCNVLCSIQLHVSQATGLQILGDHVSSCQVLLLSGLGHDAHCHEQSAAHKPQCSPLISAGFK